MVDRDAVRLMLRSLRIQGYMARGLMEMSREWVLAGAAARGTYRRATFRGAVTYTYAGHCEAWPRLERIAPAPLAITAGRVMVDGVLWGAPPQDIVADVLQALKDQRLPYEWTKRLEDPLILLP
jgi:hypothetical protein